MSKINIDVRDDCRVSPANELWIATSCGLSSSSMVTSQGPVGPYP